MNHLELVTWSGGRCVDIRHDCANGCEESRIVDGVGCEIVVEESENGRAERSKIQSRSSLMENAWMLKEGFFFIFLKGWV
jgi:hypothetical protein